ncbi:calcium channel flower isoform X2 [Planococcus citri]|uniref:calcium channel flower isoform X2 n=1 Tax=Planococcus citri TaxID=170843 RepID=UPI0031F98F79
MSFAEKIGALMARPNDDLVNKDEVPWWLKYSARGLGTVGGGLALFLGIFNIITSFLTFSCILAGIMQAIVAFTVLAIEAPCCCMFVDYVQDASNYVEKRPYWNRAAYYMLGALIPFFMCFSFSIFFGSGLIFATGVLYGMMALGKKGTRADMAAAASPTGPAPQGEHSRTLMEDPDVWRPA